MLVTDSHDSIGPRGEMGWGDQHINLGKGGLAKIQARTSSSDV